MNAIEARTKRWSIGLLLAGAMLLAGCSFFFQTSYVGQRDKEIRKADAAIAAAKNDAQLAAAYADRGYAKGDKARYLRIAKQIGNEAYTKLFDSGIADLTKAISLDSGNADWYYRRGMIYYFRAGADMIYDRTATTYLKPAKADFLKAVSQNPKNPQALDMLGLSDASLGNWTDAIHDFEQEVALDSKSKYRLADAYCNRGLGYFGEKKFDLAVADLKQSIEMKPVQTDACECEPYGLLLAIYETQTQDYDKARSLVAEMKAAGKWIDPAYLERLKSK